jgi:hypothetical protein
MGGGYRFALAIRIHFAICCFQVTRSGGFANPSERVYMEGSTSNH